MIKQLEASQQTYLMMEKHYEHLQQENQKALKPQYLQYFTFEVVREHTSEGSKSSPNVKESD